jgi:Zn-dependent protease with chaperone function
MSFNSSISRSSKPIIVVEPNKEFKKGIMLALSSIIGFVIVYLFLFFVASVLAALCIFGGYALIIAIPKWITILVGLGLAGMGIMVFIFLIKFLFAVSKKDRTSLIEISEKEQPKLFAVIRELTGQINTPFPKKIYIAPDVNASVFYNSSFWSMFFPVRKNLQIGLGLVNCLNVSEFKAVMAHEFGHFSQRSMKLGSYVYNVNRIIYNMLYENTSYGNFINSWARVGNVFALFAHITVKIVQEIQWVLKQMYSVVNKSYMQLSREMEFHADAIAAHACGSDHMISALRRAELGDSCYQLTLQKCNELLKSNKRSNNLYLTHRVVLKKCGEVNNLLITHDLPVVNAEFIERHNLSRVNFKDPWASHPTLQERADHLSRLALSIPAIDESAWVLFENTELLQAQLTNQIYKPVEIAKDALIDLQEFEDYYDNEIALISFPKEYKGYYQNRQIAYIDMNELICERPEKDFDQLFSATHVVLPKKIEAVSNDIDLLNAIANKSLDANSFDFNGRKYHRSEAPALKEVLEKELEEDRQLLQLLDKQVIQFFYHSAMEKSQQDADILKSSYVEYFELQRDADHFMNELNQMLEGLQPIYRGQTLGIEEINDMIGNLKNSGEKAFKMHLEKWVATGAFYGDNTLLQRVQKFIDIDYAYFSGNSFFDHELFELNELARESWEVVNMFVFRKFKTLLEMQLKFIPKVVIA